MLSGLLPGLGQTYDGRWVRGTLLLLLPIFTLGLAGSFVAIADPLTSFVLRNAPLVTALTVGGAFAYHLFVVGDAFVRAGLPRRGADYVALGAIALVLVVGYGSVYRESSPWAALAAKIFAPIAASAPEPASPATWSGTDRLNILLLGIDTRSPDPTTANTDTMIVLSLDPLNRTASMLSLPRDILIDRPGVLVDKINAALAFGGPELSRRVVADLLGVPIHAYAIVDFAAFERIVDAVGGVVVDVKRPLRDEFFPTSDFGVERIEILPGPQLMRGEVALTYARSRHDSSDYNRAKRQQDVLFALRSRLGQGDLLRRLPGIMDSAGNLVRTNFDPTNVLPLARFGSGLESGAIRGDVLYPCGSGFPHCELRSNQCEGGCYLFPDPAKVRDLAAQLFYDPRVRQENARVEVRGAGTRSGVAQTVADRLSERAFAIASVTDAPAARTAVLLRNAAKRYTADALAAQLGGVPVQDLPPGDATAADVVLRLGTDFRGLATDGAR